VTTATELERLGRARLDWTMADARRGAHPGRVYDNDNFTQAPDTTAAELRARLGRDREWWLLTGAAEGNRYGRIRAIVWPAADASSVNIETFDFDSDESVALSQPTKKGLLGGWKPTGPVTRLGPAAPLPLVIDGPAVCFELGDIALEERRRLIRELEATGVPHAIGGRGERGYVAFVQADHLVQVTSIPGWPAEPR